MPNEPKKPMQDDKQDPQRKRDQQDPSRKDYSQEEKSPGSKQW